MTIHDLPFTSLDWAGVPAVEHPGETGTSAWRTFEGGGVRARIVTYGEGFRSDHWCARGHVLQVLEGELVVELRDGRSFTLGPGSGFVAGDDERNPHLARSDRGATVFIVD
jgi:quercetin dioxygenase-like cupin family protein